MTHIGQKINLDFKGREVKHLIVNGHEVNNQDVFKDHRINLPQRLLNPGHNEVRVRFVSQYSRECQGIHYFKDPDDGEEYLYS